MRAFTLKTMQIGGQNQKEGPYPASYGARAFLNQSFRALSVNVNQGAPLDLTLENFAA